MLTINNEVCNFPDILMPVDKQTVRIVHENGTEEDVSIETDHPVRQECLDTLIGDTDKVYNEDKNSTKSPQEDKNNNFQSNKNSNYTCHILKNIININETIKNKETYLHSDFRKYSEDTVTFSKMPLLARKKTRKFKKEKEK